MRNWPRKKGASRAAITACSPRTRTTTRACSRLSARRARMPLLTPILKGATSFSAATDGLVFNDNSEQGVVRNNRFYHDELGISCNFPKHGRCTISRPL